MCMKLPSFRSRSAWRSQRALRVPDLSLDDGASVANGSTSRGHPQRQGAGRRHRVHSAAAAAERLRACRCCSERPLDFIMLGRALLATSRSFAVSARRFMGLPDISPECQATLDSWCNERSHCPHAATHGRLHARFDRATMNPASAWRCYAEDTLSPDLRSYSHGHAYCTRQLGLQEIYTECREVSEPTHVQVSSTGASVVLPVPASPPSPSPSPLPSPPSSPSKPPELDLTQWEALEPWTHEGELTCPVSYPRAGSRLEPRLRSAR